MTRIRLCILTAAMTAGALTLSFHDAQAADEYVVRPGDSLYVIANRLDVTLGDLLRTNGLSITSVIQPGQRLTVPTSSAGSPASGGTASSGGPAGSYTVMPGDGLGRIAARHGVSLSSLLAANGLRASSVIQPGQRLTIPSAGTASGASPSGNGTTPSSAGTYTVASGDWLSQIASRHGVSLSSLLAANGLTATSLILPGQRLTIPTGGAPGGGNSGGGDSSAASGRSYTIVPGDTLGTIATRHGVSLRALLSANQLTASSLILPGRTLTIPAGGTPGSSANGDGAAAVRVESVVQYALAQAGKGYRFAGRGPYAFDCSGLTLMAFARAGVTLVPYSAAQARQGRAVSFWTEPIQRGDLVFQDTNGDGVINHVGIALSSTTWVDARNARSGVAIGPLPERAHIAAVRRLIG